MLRDERRIRSTCSSSQRRYVEARGLPRTRAELRQHRLIGFDRDLQVRRTAGGFAATLRREDFGLRTDSIAAQTALLRAGAGITARQVNRARREPELVPVLAADLMFQREIWVVGHPDLRATRPVGLLFDGLVRGLARYLKS